MALPLLNFEDYKIQENIILQNKNFFKTALKERLEAVEHFFIQRHFYYNRTPPAYSSIQNFILSGTSGYCVHFASSYAYLLRLAHIPSRIIIGFQGGEINTFDHSIVVRERDSHAWVEYLNDENHWIRLDPTELVAPERISLGSQLFFDKLEPYFNNPLFNIPKSWFRFSYINKVEYLVATIENYLSAYLFNLDNFDQKKLFHNNSALYFCIVFILFLFSSFYLSKRNLKRKITKEEKEYRLFLKKYRKRGYPKLDSETLSEYQSRLRIAFPYEINHIDKEVDQYITFFYH